MENRKIKIEPRVRYVISDEETNETIAEFHNEKDAVKYMINNKSIQVPL